MSISSQNAKNHNQSIAPEEYIAPHTAHFHEKAEFDKAVGEDFIRHANAITGQGEAFFIGLAHGISPSGPYKYILKNFDQIIRPDLLYFTFTNSLLESQSDVDDAFDARAFLKALIKVGGINSDQVYKEAFDRENIEESVRIHNDYLYQYLHKHNKHGFDYVFLACNPAGKVAAISRNSSAFDSERIIHAVHEGEQSQVTITPYFIRRARRIAFMATKSDKRRALAWLYAPWGSPDESPSFLRHLDDLQERMTVFIDDHALTWPQIEIKRETRYGESKIKIDLAQPYNAQPGKKRPVILLVHGFLGLNSFDGLLTTLSSNSFIPAAMHYGSIPNDLPPADYSQHVVQNIDCAIQFFGSKGHPVYLFDHSMGNIYFLMMDHQFHQLKGVKNYLCGRIGANPFFGEEAKHAVLGFLDNVILPAMSMTKNLAEKTMFLAARSVIPVDTRKGVRRRGIRLSKWMITADSRERDKIWQAAKERILYLMSNMDSLPDLNRIPIGRALNRLPAKIFAIQVHSALLASKAFDRQRGLTEMEKQGIPVLILKSDKDGVAKYVRRLYESSNVEVKDVTIYHERDLFKEHLYHMVDPIHTSKMIVEFIEANQERCQERNEDCSEMV